MKKEWENVVISKVYSAVYVPERKGNTIHKDRPFHGIVINDVESDKEYIFSPLSLSVIDGKPPIARPTKRETVGMGNSLSAQLRG